MMQLLDLVKRRHRINVKTRLRMLVCPYSLSWGGRDGIDDIAEDLAYLRNPIWWAGMVTSKSMLIVLEG
jgi:hypothetical protein